MNNEGMQRFRKATLYSFLGFLCLTALFTIYIVLVGGYDDFKIRVLLTTTVIAMCSIACMCCAAYAQRLANHIFPVTGIVLAVLSGFLTIMHIWTEPWDDFFYWQITATESVFAFSFAQFSVLSLPRLRKSHQWVHRAAGAIIFLLAVLITGAIFTGDRIDVIEFTVEIGVPILAVLSALVTLAIPILSRIPGGESAGERETLILTRGEDGELRGADGRVYGVREDEASGAEKGGL